MKKNKFNDQKNKQKQTQKKQVGAFSLTQSDKLWLYT